MRKSITTVLALLCALVLAACNGSPVKAPDTSDDAGSFYVKEGEPKSEITGTGTDYPDQELSEPESYAFEAQYIRTDGYSGDRSYPYHTVIDSKEELDAYYEANRELFDLEPKAAVYSDSTLGFLDACGKYDDSYFEVQNLVLIVLEEGSGSIRHEITDVRPRRDESGASLGWDISVDRTVPEVVTDDMAQWHLFLEVEMGNVIKDGDNIWINGELSGPPQP